MLLGIDYIGVTTPFYCNDGKGNFVMHQRGANCRDEQGRWDFGGGKVEFGETLEQAVLREVQEEYGVEGMIQEQVPAHSVFRKENGVKSHWLAIPFFIQVDITKVKNMEPEKAAKISIVRLDNLPEPLHFGLKYSLKRYSIYFQKYNTSSNNFGH